MKSLASFVVIILLQSSLFHVYGLRQTSSHNILKDSSPFPSDVYSMKVRSCLMPDGKSLNNWDVFTHEHPGMNNYLQKNWFICLFGLALYVGYSLI